MNKLDSLLTQYAESHQNRTNVRIHKVAVPTILFCILGLLWPVQPAGIPLACVASGGFLLFALSLDRPLAALLALELAAFNLALWQLYAHVPMGVGLAAVGTLFVLAWVLQFVGHHIEGKKPSFLNDLLFLLVGPLWTLHLLHAARATSTNTKP